MAYVGRMKKLHCNGTEAPFRLVAAIVLILFAMAQPCRADEQFGPLQPVADYFINWFPRVTEIQREQPHWITPLVTVTPGSRRNFATISLFRRCSTARR